MRAIVTGASGLVGRSVVQALLRRGDDVVATSRVPSRHAWPRGVEARAWDGTGPLDLAGIDAVVHLAGAGVMDHRWSRRYRDQLVASRVRSTRRVAEALGDNPMPSVFASAVGWYGEHPAGPQTESMPAGDGFLAGLCSQWESEATGAIARFGVVLDPSGGALGRLEKLYRRRMGARLGDGQQPFPWVHRDDAVAAILWILANGSGPYNVVAPSSDTNADLHGAMRRVLGVRGLPPAPRFAIKMVLGAAASTVLDGQRAVPQRLVAAGFSFRWVQLEPAVRDLLKPASGG